MKSSPTKKKTSARNFNQKLIKGYNVGTSPLSDDTYRILMTNGKMAGKVIVRRQVYFNERSFPARKMTPKNSMLQPLKPDDGSDLIELTFVDDGESFK